jgi:Leucine-rich repeat (LRR) protein
LAQVDARSNQLVALPGALGDAASVLELRLGFNQLTTLPASIGLLRSLKTLDLRNNLIEVRG